ncbi:PD40 domain-containing protein [Azospirillum rugosum]|uniref:Tol biopolymer transport system component n=1 Tax=Azospirillum rugosum TaxID=416170 RepID=A0ABS4SQU3_9PROT|nr:PD40 domain-containing protein [Azospirillum rugosum]MBP2294913.1 Tol biopolymer transport system component [Azospirillum rugosum]MDQ0528165.1 Tol biopolymer transport system component [Azospirillum rugosum]
MAILNGGADALNGGAGGVAAVTRVSTAADGTQADDGSTGVISADGRYVAFSSGASNLVAGDSNDLPDLFLRDLQTGTVTRIEMPAFDDTQSRLLGVVGFSADGSKLLYTSVDPVSDAYSSPRTLIHIRDVATGAETTLNGGTNSIANLALSADGKTLSYVSTGLGIHQAQSTSVVLRDLETGSFNAYGNSDSPAPFTATDPVLSSDGKFLVYTNNGALRLLNRETNQVDRLDRLPDGSLPDGGMSTAQALSADGRYLLFTSDVAGLDANNGGSAGVYVRDLTTGTTRLVSTAVDGTPADGTSRGVTFGPDGKSVLFTSYAGNLVEGDTNGTKDVFLKDLDTGAVRRVSLAADGSQLNADVTGESLSADGTRLLFATMADNVVDGDTNGLTDLFVATLNRSSDGNAGTPPDTTPPAPTPPTDTTTPPPVDTRPSTDMQRVVDGVTETVKAYAYEGPVPTLKWAFMGDGRNEVVKGSADNDFINLLGGTDAADGGAGDDVLDGGSGSNWLVGGAGNDTFFIDGRNPQATWSTIMDLEKGEWATLWGYKPGTSNLTWEEMGGADGNKGATAHVDINGDGTIDASVTFAGKAVGAITATTGSQGDQSYIAFINL